MFLAAVIFGGIIGELQVCAAGKKCEAVRESLGKQAKLTLNMHSWVNIIKNDCISCMKV
jgi:hypothetical protein